MKHYSTIKKEILLLVTKCFDFECVILNERSQKKTNTLALVLCVEVFSFFFFFFFFFFFKNEINRLVARDQMCCYQMQGMEGKELNEGGQKVQNSSYKINKY